MVGHGSLIHFSVVDCNNFLSLVLFLRNEGGDKARGDDSNVAIGVNYGVASPLNWSKSIYNSETVMTRINGRSMKDILSFSHGTP